ncbi:hypothetical protein G3H63_15535 [Microbacterium resistens]|uniref:hypothetical protein n=1 Tax=Microbacterium resistens TaxID=156977 RepID=UPI001C55E1FE|nr:hypothetical protein [Microbacterium resistens]MBW1640476.1 hypothetical protein [Microbacterium resistens]
MPYTGPGLPEEGTDPWFIPFKEAWDGLVAYVEDVEAQLAAKANVADLGTAAAAAVTDFATAAQGAKADAAVPSTRMVAGKALSADVTLTKDDIGLANVDNTSDAEKPVSSAQQAALDEKVTSIDGTVSGLWQGTQAEHAAIDPKQPRGLYFTKD